MRKFLSNVWRLLLNEHPSYLLRSSEFFGENEFRTIPQIKRALSDDENKPIFLIGPWGSGKTVHAKKLMASEVSPFSFAYRSFFSISTPREAYAHLIEPKVRLWTIFSLALVIGIICWGIDSITWKIPAIEGNVRLGISFFGFMTTLLLGSNRMKAVYLLGSIFATRFGNGQRVTIIDDLERSSMSVADQWAMLANLWAWHQKHIVLLGYATDDEKIKIIEMATKLDGNLIFLPIRPDINVKIAKDLDAGFPFVSGDWLAILTPRQLSQIREDVELALYRNEFVKIQPSKTLRSVLYINLCFERLLINLSITEDMRGHFNFTIMNRQQITYNTERYPGRNNPIPLNLDKYARNFINSIPEKLKLAIAANDNAVSIILGFSDIDALVSVALELEKHMGADK